MKYAHRFYPGGERPVDDGGHGESATEEVGGGSIEELGGKSSFALPSSPARPSSAGTAPGSCASPPAAVGVEARGEILELRRELEDLKERVAELETTFVKFLK